MFGITLALSLYAAYEMYQRARGRRRDDAGMARARAVRDPVRLDRVLVRQHPRRPPRPDDGKHGTLDIDTGTPLPALSTRTALLLPTYNEDPDRVRSRVQAVYESVVATGLVAHFDVFILSDTTDPDVFVAEEAAFLALRARVWQSVHLHRHRPKNEARKAGNIAEWVRRFGGAYAQMVVLDADTPDDRRHAGAACGRDGAPPQASASFRRCRVMVNGTTPVRASCSNSPAASTAH